MAAIDLNQRITMSPVSASPAGLSADSDRAIAPTQTAVRPTLSVMIPTFEPNAYLVETLRSVLRQDVGGAEMQVAVVDDASRDSDIDALIRNAGGAGRVEIYRSNSNQGLARNWNQCVRMARGSIVHILHQDDAVRDGFYARMVPVFARHAHVGMAFCRHAYVDGEGRLTHRTPRERLTSGVLGDWLTRIAEKQRIQCAAALVRRETYEQLGGYRTDLRYALDWEMWVRIAAHGPVWFEPKLLAHYRRHGRSETQRLRDADEVDRDVLRAIEIFAAYLPEKKRAELAALAYANFARQRLKQLSKLNPTDNIHAADLLATISAALEKTVDSQPGIETYRRQYRVLERRFARPNE